MSEACSGCSATLPGDGATYGPRRCPFCLSCWLARAEAGRRWWRIQEVMDRAAARGHRRAYYRLAAAQMRLDPAGTIWRLGA